MKGGAGFEHGAGDLSRRSATDRGLCRECASTPKFDVFAAGSRIALHGDTRPVVEGVGEAVLAALPTHEDATFAERLVTGATSVKLSKAA